jgi:hypothetical protein
VPRRQVRRVVVDGGEGFDTLTVEGTSSSEHFRLSADQERIRLERGRLRVSASGIERIDVAGRTGSDELDIADLSGTELQEIHTDGQQRRKPEVDRGAVRKGPAA